MTTEAFNNQSTNETTPGLGIPLLTEDEIGRLISREDHGVNSAGGIRRFPTFDDWQKSGGVKTKDNFHARFNDSSFGELHREMQYFQRYAVLYPEELEDLRGVTRETFSNPDNIPKRLPEEIDKKYWTAYERLAGLVDVNDAMITNRQVLPPGHAMPDLLTA